MDASDEEEDEEDAAPPSAVSRRTVGFREEGRDGGDRLLRLEMQLAHLTDAFTKMACHSPGALCSSPHLRALQQPSQPQAALPPAAPPTPHAGSDYVEISTQEAAQARQQAELAAKQHAVQQVAGQEQLSPVTLTPAQGPATAAFRARQPASGSKHTPY